jgi:methylenetetrahydrofolate reductase (NADPH)
VTKFLGEASPDPLFIALAGLDAFHASANLGAHLFPFGGVERSARWIAAVAAGHFRMYAGGGGFELVP